MKSFSGLPGITRRFVDCYNLLIPHCFKICGRILSHNPRANRRVVWGVIQQSYCRQQSQVMF
jgi:hypothetical protein